MDMCKSSLCKNCLQFSTKLSSAVFIKHTLGRIFFLSDLHIYYIHEILNMKFVRCPIKIENAPI